MSVCGALHEPLKLQLCSSLWPCKHIDLINMIHLKHLDLINMIHWYTSSIWIWSTWYTSNILIWSTWYTSNILIWSKWYTSNVLPGWTLLFRQTVLFLTFRSRWSHPKLGRLYTCLSVKYKYRNRKINHQKYLIMISGILSRFLRASKMKHKS